MGWKKTKQKESLRAWTLSLSWYYFVTFVIATLSEYICHTDRCYDRRRQFSVGPPHRDNNNKNGISQYEIWKVIRPIRAHCANKPIQRKFWTWNWILFLGPCYPADRRRQTDRLTELETETVKRFFFFLIFFMGVHSVATMLGKLQHFVVVDGKRKMI